MRIDYDELFARLARPRVRRVLADHMPGVLIPCRADDDPNWPAPTEAPSADNSPVVGMLELLPHRQRVVMMATAARLMVPIWMAVVDHADASYGVVPAAVDAIEGWIFGTASASDLEEAQRSTWNVADHSHGGVVGHAAAAAVSNASWAVDEESRTITSGKWCLYWATEAAFRFAGSPETNAPRENFLAEWWARCRCRLAFIDATSAQLE